MSAPNTAATGCATCPAHNAAHLVKLGVEMDQWDFVVALAGNPNVGKSTVFNALTGLRQHTGNWPGKTVTRAEGGLVYRDQRYKLVDLPGTYSLLSSSLDEEIARDFILFARPDVTLIVVDATRLERNLNLALQVLQITDRAVICLNLMDQARRLGLAVDERLLSRELGVPVVAASARYGRGLDLLIETLAQVATGSYVCRPPQVGGQTPALQSAVSALRQRVERDCPGLPNAEWVALRLLDGDERMVGALRSGELAALAAPAAVAAPAAPAAVADALLAEARRLRWQIGPDYYQALAEQLYTEAASIADRAVTRAGEQPRFDFDRTVDRLVTNRWFGLPLMVLLLTLVFWLTIAGANVPSALLAQLLVETMHPLLKQGAAAIALPWWLSGLLIDGMYLSTAWVVSVMLPPMAIFFPLFTLLEDFGYLPRVAFNLDHMFKRVGAHGKQALTMTMGFGCNAAAVVSARIIESPRERLLAIITNNFALCNGRWPTQILMATVFIGALVPGPLAGLTAALAVVAVALLGVLLTFGSSWVLSRTVLRGEPSTFSLELPAYRPPRVLQTLYTSLLDRTAFVLWRAIVFALPAGAAIWLLGNVHLGDATIAEHAIAWLDPLGVFVGLSGVILLAYIVAIPANEIVIPTVLMLTVLSAGAAGSAAPGAGAGVLFQPSSNGATGELLRAAGWTLPLAVNLMLFSLVHNPCSTTIYTIWKETRSGRWTALAALAPVLLGLALCFAVARCWRLLA
ncbi:MAG: ferrous iron transport protein B [Proteobacteria bacterium]|nr:ferrous iron transport protein B [Pseudomonadota bacterium]